MFHRATPRLQIVEIRHRAARLHRADVAVQSMDIAETFSSCSMLQELFVVEATEDEVIVRENIEAVQRVCDGYRTRTHHLYVSLHGVQYFPS